jgi:hypothetical protein
LYTCSLKEDESLARGKSFRRFTECPSWYFTEVQLAYYYALLGNVNKKATGVPFKP